MVVKFEVLKLVSPVELVLPFRVENMVEGEVGGRARPVMEIWCVLGILFKIVDEQLCHFDGKSPP